MDRNHAQARPAGLLLGVGLGGFVDGIVLHQIAQWHNMLSARVPPTTTAAMRANMTADGWFHTLVWVSTLADVALLYRAAGRGVPLPSGRWFAGVMVFGFGLFNLVEGVVDHHLLDLHHVRDVPVYVPAYDYAFLLVGGLGVMALGWALARSSAEQGVTRG